MAERPADLPEFEHPPVVEVAIGVQSEPIRGFRQAHLGIFWDRVRNAYPRSQDQERLDTPIEALAGGAGQPVFKLELLDSPPANRAWFISEDDSLLIQLQDDRIIHNWRHRGGPYPRFGPLLDLFWSHVDTLSAVIDETGLAPMPVRQAEVTYINWIDTVDMAEFFRPSVASTIDVPGIGPMPDLQQWAARYPVQEGGEVCGRLSVDAQLGRRLEGGKLLLGYQLSLTFRAPIAPDADRRAVSATLELGRSAIVRGFAALTTDAMHVMWGRTP